MEWEQVLTFLDTNLGVVLIALLWGSVAVPLWAKLKQKYRDKVERIESIAVDAYNWVEKHFGGYGSVRKLTEWKCRVEGKYNGLYKGKLGTAKALLTGMAKDKATSIARKRLGELVYGANLAKSKPSESVAEDSQ